MGAVTGPDCVRQMAHKLASATTPLRLLWLLAILTVIVASLLPSDSSAMRALDRLPVSDKAEHTAAYACLAFLPAIHERRRRVAQAAAGAVLLGVALEFAQRATGWRDFEVADMAADAVGVTAGLAMGWMFRVYAAAPAIAQSGTAGQTRRLSARRPAGRA
jgi:VanZ family protein